MKRAIFILTLLANLSVHGAGINDYYKVENIPGPKGLDVQIGGLAFLPDGPIMSPSNKIFMIYLFELIIPRSVKI